MTKAASAFACALVFAGIIVSGDAYGAVVVVCVEGPDKALAQAQATSAVGGDSALVEWRDWQSALGQQGQHGALAPALKNEKKRRVLVDRLRRAGRAVRADKVVVIVTGRTPHGREAVLTVVDVASSDTPSDAHLVLAKGDERLGAAIRQALAQSSLGAAESRETASASAGNRTTSSAAAAGGAPGGAESPAQGDAPWPDTARGPGWK